MKYCRFSQKKLIAQNLPYFYQNSLKIFINLTDCWKKIWQLWKYEPEAGLNATRYITAKMGQFW